MIDSDDLRDFYHSFTVSPTRARRNAFNIVYPASAFEGYAAYRAELAGLDVVPCLNTLGMGDCLAVELAQAAHLGLLRACGAGRPEHFVRYGSPFPRGPLYEFLAIDDHVALEEIPLAAARSSSTVPRAAPAIFDRAGDAYLRAGLARHEGKAVRGATDGEVLGAEIDGLADTVGPPQARVATLVSLTLRVCRAGRVPPRRVQQPARIVGPCSSGGRSWRSSAPCSGCRRLAPPPWIWPQTC